MGKFSQEEFDQFIINQGILGFFKEPIKLVSGRMSSWYVNWRNVAGDAFLMDKLSDFVLAYVEDSGLDPDCFYGVPEGATKLGVIAQLKWAKSRRDFAPGRYPLAMGRKLPKDHGDPKDRFFVGAPRGKVIIIEDVTNTGNSLISTIDNLKENGITPIATLVLTHRNMKPDNGTIREILKEKGVAYHFLSNALELLPKMYNKEQPGEGIKKSIEAEFVKYGEQEIKL